MLSVSNSVTVSRLMARFREGDSGAAGQLVELFYPELRRLAAAYMIKERPGHTWQATALVNELYLELVKIRALRANGTDGSAERAAFFGLAAHLMRRLLIHHARPLSRQAMKVDLPHFAELQGSGLEALAEIENALSRLASINPKLRAVVEAKVFEGLTIQQTADSMDCGTATVERHWGFARRWLAQEFGQGLTG
jgi:RNA polymerase sigma-70 factor (ECF subfamily)